MQNVSRTVNKGVAAAAALTAAAAAVPVANANIVKSYTSATSNTP